MTESDWLHYDRPDRDAGVPGLRRVNGTSRRHARTEVEWNSSTHPEQMLLFVRNNGKAGERKLRLFACASCRRIWPLLGDAHGRMAVDAAEQNADGMIDGEILAQASFLAYAVSDTGEPHGQRAYLAAEATGDPAQPSAWAGVGRTASQAGTASEHVQDERRAQGSLLRDIFGDSMRPIAVNPAWRTPTVLSLRRRAYEERHLPAGTLASVLLAALGGALEQAGCTDWEILGQLRREGAVHVRGS